MTQLLLTAVVLVALEGRVPAWLWAIFLLCAGVDVLLSAARWAQVVQIQKLLTTLTGAVVGSRPPWEPNPNPPPPPPARRDPTSKLKENQ